jgi:hypothetical protein
LFCPKVFRKPGDRKFVWFRTLKSSARNWILNVSDIAGIRVFLKTDKSTVVSLGP